MPKERQAFRRNAMKNYLVYRGTKYQREDLREEPVSNGPYFYRGSKWTYDMVRKEPQVASGIYRGVKWGTSR